MAVPYLRNVLRGWVENATATKITVTVVSGRKVEATTDITIKVNAQPMPPEQIKRKPEEQWTWKWWSIIEPNGSTFETNDIVAIGSKRFRIESKTDWTRSGFTKYDAVEDYQ